MMAKSARQWLSELPPAVREISRFLYEHLGCHELSTRLDPSTFHDRFDVMHDEDGFTITCRRCDAEVAYTGSKQTFESKQAEASAMLKALGWTPPDVH